MNMEINVTRNQNLVTYEFSKNGKVFKVLVNKHNELTWKFSGGFPSKNTRQAISYVINTEKDYRNSLFVYVPYNAHFMIKVFKEHNFNPAPSRNCQARHLWELSLNP